MEVVEKDSRRSLIRTFFASVAAAGAGVFGVAHAQAPASELVKRTSSTIGHPATSRRCSPDG